MSVTRNDVAQWAGVSSATVSRAYNCPERVTADKLERVREAAAALGYVPDRHASALRRTGTGTILLLMPPGTSNHASEERVYDWLYADAVRAVQAVIDDSMYNLRLATARGAAAVTKRVVAGGFDGLICGVGTLDKFPLVLRRNEIPYVCCTQGDSLPRANLCHIHERQGGAEAAAALQRHGRKHPAHITGDLVRNRACQERWEGFRHAFPRTRIRLLDGELGVHGGYVSAKRLLPTIRRGEIDSIFVVNDLTGVGVLHALQEAKIDVPRDVAIIGYDNLPIIHTLTVPLATLDINMGLLYRTATEQLLALLRTPQAPGDPPIRIPIPPTFVPGPSLGEK